MRQNSKDSANTHLTSQRSLKGTSTYNNQSMNRDRTIDSFDIVEPSNQNSFGNLSQRPSAKRNTRRLKPSKISKNLFKTDKFTSETKNKLLSTRILTGNKVRSRKQRMLEQENNESLTGENMSLKIKYSAIQDENNRLKDQLQNTERELHRTSGNMKDIASKYSGSGKRNKKQVNSQSKNNVDQNAALRQKNMIIDGLQKQIEGNLFM